MEILRHDLRYALRSLVKSPLFSLVAIAILALGIGTNSGAFTFVNAFLLRPLPFADPGRLIHVWETDQLSGQLDRTSLPTFRDWQEQSELIAEMAVFNYTSGNLTGIGGARSETPERLPVGRVSANVFELLGVEPIRGRGFLAGEDLPGAAPVAVLSHRFWQDRMNAEAAAVGKTVRFDDTTYTVVGIMPPEFVFPLPITEVWLPHVLDEGRHPRDDRYLQVVGRLRPGATRSEAQSELDAIAGRLEAAYPTQMAHRGARVESLRAALNFADEIIDPMSVVLLLATLFVLLIVCANLVHLMLARAAGRQRELSVRLALGAGRGVLVRQLLAESVLLAVAGGVLGLVLAHWSNRWMESLVPPDLYRVGSFDLDLASLVFTFAVSVACAAFCGLVPAWRIARLDPQEGLKESGSATFSRRSRRSHNLLVTAQVGLALVLLVGSSLMVRSLGNMQRVDPGFEAERVLSLELSLPSVKYGDDERITLFHRQLVSRVAELPGVEAAATVNYLPLNHEAAYPRYDVLDQPAPEPEQPRASTLAITPDYFRTMGIPLLEGRAFDDRDNAGAPAVAIVNRALARKHWPDSSALGRRLRLSWGDREMTIVGVVGDTRHLRLDDYGLSQLYLPEEQDPQSYHRLLVRSAGDPTLLANAVRAEVWALDGGLPITEVRTLAEVIETFLLPQWSLAVVLGVLGAGALVLASLGIYGVMALYAGQRRQEVGLRMALGARRSHVLALVLGQGMKLTVIGLAAGLAVAVGMALGLRSFLFQVGIGDPVSFLGIPLVLALVALVACWFPARRAARVDPMAALRYE